MNQLLNKNRYLILLPCIFLVFSLLYRQANNSLWRAHLEIDTWNYHLKVADFIKTGSFSSTIGNEILPPTFFSLLIPALFVSWAPFNYSEYLFSFFIFVLVTLLVHWWLVAKNRPFWQTIVFTVLILSFGPVLLFRFDGLAALLVILSLNFFNKRRYWLAGIIYGLVVAIKIYPVIFLPYLLLLLFYQKKYRALASFLSFSFFGLVAPIIIFLSFGGQSSQITEGLNFHNLKYVSLESIPGSGLTLSSLIAQGKPPQIIGGYGVWGITTPLIERLGLNWFNRFWIVPIFLFYLYLLKVKYFFKKINYGIIFCLMLLFLVFSKNLHAQYVWWFLSLFPLLQVRRSAKLSYIFMAILLFFIGIFNQLVYPLYYTQFIEDFYRHNRHYAVFYCLLLRNLLIISLTIFSLKSVLIKRRFS